MLLREHPLMRFHGVSSWPPVWAWVSGAENRKARGEVGILEEVVLSNLRPLNRCYLYIEHENSTYIGCLLIDDEAFCNQVIKLLRCYYKYAIAGIGSLDLSHTL
jgi:hypothetical protein